MTHADNSPAGLPPAALTVAGSDSGGGAGVQADLKTFLAHGVYGMSALAALTAQNTRGVQGILGVPPAFLVAQLESVRADLPIHAIKIGMLGDEERIAAVADFLEGWAGRPPVVLDPVMVAKGGAPLLAPGAAAMLRDRLAPLASLLTPNLPEAAALGLDPEAGAWPEALRGVPVLLKGGHAEGPEVVDRLLVWRGGAGGEIGVVAEFRHPRVASRNTHGTGCTLSSAIAARLARGAGLEEACRGAVAWVAGLVAASVESYGGGHGPLLHGLRGPGAG